MYLKVLLSVTAVCGFLLLSALEGSTHRQRWKEVPIDVMVLSLSRLSDFCQHEILRGRADLGNYRPVARPGSGGGAKGWGPGRGYPPSRGGRAQKIF